MVVPRGRDAAAGAGAGRDGRGLGAERGGDGVVGGDVAEGVAGDGAHRRAVHGHAGHLVAGGGGDGEGLAGAGWIPMTVVMVDDPLVPWLTLLLLRAVIVPLPSAVAVIE